MSTTLNHADSIEASEGMIEIDGTAGWYYKFLLSRHRICYPYGYVDQRIGYHTPAATRALIERLWDERPKALAIGAEVVRMECRSRSGPFTIHITSRGEHAS